MTDPVTLETPLGQFPDVAQEVIRTALRLKWTGVWTSKQQQMVKLRSPDGTAELNIPSTNINHKRVKSWVNTITRHSSIPDLLIEAQALGDRPRKANTELLRGVAAAAQKAKPKTDDLVERAQARHREVLTEQAQQVIAEAPVQHGVADDEPYVVSSVPWLVKAGPDGGGAGSMYESPHTLEELMSDGTTRYKCRHCDVTSDNGKSVSLHSGAKHGANRNRERIKVEDYGPVDHRPPKQPRLISDILDALDAIENWHSLSKEILAEKVAALIIEARPDRTPAEPLTPEQVIERIRYLVDGERIGAMHTELDSLREQYTEAVARAEAAETEAAAAKAETDRVRDNLRALDSLVRDMVGDEEKVTT